MLLRISRWLSGDLRPVRAITGAGDGRADVLDIELSTAKSTS